MDGLLSKLRSLDAYPKVNEDFYSRTLSGGLITLASSFVMLLLFVSELRTRLPPSSRPRISDSDSGLRRILTAWVLDSRFSARRRGVGRCPSRGFALLVLRSRGPFR
jgi:hypothetical protein